MSHAFLIFICLLVAFYGGNAQRLSSIWLVGLLMVVWEPHLYVITLMLYVAFEMVSCSSGCCFEASLFSVCMTSFMKFQDMMNISYFL